MVLSIPALVKALSVFGLILVLSRLRVTLSISLIIGSLVLGLWMGLGPLRLTQSVFFSITRLQTIGLALIVWTILVISRLMKESGHLDRIVDIFGRLSRDDRMAGSVMPALIGLLPMPGGALFSAPMVETAFCNRHITGEKKTVVNYWFRHIWEYWWPLYPGVVLAVALLDVDTWRFMIIMAPMTLVTVLSGVIFLLRSIGKKEEHNKTALSWEGIKIFLWEIMPILVVVLVIMAFSGLASLLALAGFGLKIFGAFSILPGLVASTIWVCVVNHISFRQFRLSVMDLNVITMMFLIAAIMVFKGVMMDSGAVLQIRDELVAYNIPVMLIILAMPFLSGFITGIAIGFVGTSFPLIIPMFQTPDTLKYLSCAATAYTFGYMGMMLSPVHLCFLVTKDYFNANLLKCYRHLILPVLSVMVMSLLIFSILGNI